MINRSIFRMYDIRGRVGTDLDEAAVRAIAGAFGRYVQEQGRNKIIVGRDNRFSSPRFRELVVETLLPAGLDVVDIGEVITPMFYFASRHLDIDAGIMITASHNPGDDNGFKLLLGSSTIYGEDILKIARLAEAGDYTSSASKGNLSFYDISPAYRQDIMKRIKLGERQLKVVVDCGNGTASFIAPRLLRELGCEV
ncbi:MAG: phosphomannomutase, partial [Syntrophomonas sp.]|nr:phosphomannomutase [Syntrophomonas sp.]